MLFKHVISESVYAFWGFGGDRLRYDVYENKIPVYIGYPDDDITVDAVFSSLGNACMINDLTLKKTFVMQSGV